MVKSCYERINAENKRASGIGMNEPMGGAKQEMLSPTLDGGQMRARREGRAKKEDRFSIGGEWPLSAFLSIEGALRFTSLAGFGPRHQRISE